MTGLGEETKLFPRGFEQLAGSFRKRVGRGRSRQHKLEQHHCGCVGLLGQAGDVGLATPTGSRTWCRTARAYPGGQTYYQITAGNECKPQVRFGKRALSCIDFSGSWSDTLLAVALDTCGCDKADSSWMQ